MDYVVGIYGFVLMDCMYVCMYVEGRRLSGHALRTSLPL